VSHQAKELYNSLEFLKKAQQGTTCENYNIVNNHQLKAPSDTIITTCCRWLQSVMQKLTLYYLAKEK
jgi:hypothetical protein